MADIGTLVDFSDGNILYAAQLDSNFGAIRTVVNGAVVHTDKASQVITKSVTFTPDSGVGFTVSTGGATITAGDLTLTADDLIVTGGNITVTAGDITLTAGDLVVTAGGITVTAGTTAVQALTCTTINASGDITGTLAAGAQNNVTGMSGLTSATISGTLTLSNASPLSLAATSKFVVGATSFSIKDSGDGVTAFGLTGTGTASTVAIGCGASGAITVTGNSGNSVQLSTSHTKLLATGGMVFLATDGSSPTSASTTVSLPCMPHVSTPPSGSLGSGKIGAFCVEPGDNKMWVWSGSAWKYITLN